MTMLSRILTILVLALFASTGTAADQGPSTPTERTDGMGKGQTSSISNEIKKMEGKIDLVFVGDSITKRWGGDNWKKHWGEYRAVNMGVGGDQTQNVLYRLQNGQLDGYKARLFVLLVGTNNIGKNTNPDDVAAGIKAILDLIKSKQPEAKILLLGIFPTGDRPLYPPAGDKPNIPWEKKSAVNKLISNYAGGQIHYMDIGAKFVKPDGLIDREAMPDCLHLADKGFDIWAESIKDKVKELMGEVKAK